MKIPRFSEIAEQFSTRQEFHNDVEIALILISSE